MKTHPVSVSLSFFRKPRAFLVRFFSPIETETERHEKTMKDGLQLWYLMYFDSENNLRLRLLRKKKAVILGKLI